jgi:hypothetical protein
MYSRPSKRRTARCALVFFSLATVIGAGTVLGAVERGDLVRPLGSVGELPAPANIEPAQRGAPYMSGDCRDPMASFLNPACHSTEPRKLHVGHLTHRLATAVIGRTDARE